MLDFFGHLIFKIEMDFNVIWRFKDIPVVMSLKWLKKKRVKRIKKMPWFDHKNLVLSIYPLNDQSSRWRRMNWTAVNIWFSPKSNKEEKRQKKNEIGEKCWLLASWYEFDLVPLLELAQWTNFGGIWLTLWLIRRTMDKTEKKFLICRSIVSID